MMKTAILVVLMMLISSPTLAAWPNTWSTTPDGSAGNGQSRAGSGNRVFIVIPAAAVVNDWSPPMDVRSTGGRICLDTDSALEAVGGTVTVGVYFSAGDTSDVAQFVTDGTVLTSAAPCAKLWNGFYRVKILANADRPGTIEISAELVK